jgi:phage replication O-like protein O
MLQIPNYTQVPNVIFDRYMKEMTHSELLVFLVVVRKVIGYHKDEDAISISQMESMTGLARSSVVSAVASLIKEGFIVKSRTGRNNLAFYTMNFSHQKSENTTTEPNTDDNQADASGSNLLPPEKLAQAQSENSSGSNLLPTKERKERKDENKKYFADDSASAERESTNSGNLAQNNPYTGFQDTAKPKRTRKPNPVFDAIAHEIFGFDENVGKAGGRIGKVLSAMQMLKADVTAEDVSKFVVWYQGKYPNIALPQDDAKASKYFNDWLKVTSKQASPTPSMTFRKVASVQDVVSAGKSFYRVVMKNHFDKWVTIKAFNRMDDAIGFQLDYAQFTELKALVKVEGE